ncbi:MAG: TetR/AcrR family transcriptional regulator, partial [Thermodesulfobacteriota bacterium]
MVKSKAIQKPETSNTEERILQSAMRLFLERGYHGTSIEEITQAAGLTKGALYWHFKSKEDLLKRIIKEFEKRYLDSLISCVGKVNGRTINKFEKYIRFNSAFAYYNRELCVSFETLAAELIGAHHRIEPEFRRVYKKYREFLSDLIKEGKKEKVFKKDLDTDLTALALMAFHYGVLVHWSMNRDEI